jgi:SSS family solute:Na+ symporter
VGLSGSAYATGISISNYEWMASIILVFFAVFVIPYYLSSRIYTIPEFLELRFRRACRTYFSGLTIIGNVFIDTAGTLFAGALVVSHFFPGVELW